jgi:Na+-transporting methylmalonyl-CoA/oxaloacetate decarboxylase gamma subunit
MLMLLFLIVKFHVAIYHWIVRRLAQAWRSFGTLLTVKIGVGFVMVVLFLAVYIAFGAGALKIASERDWRVGLILKSPLSKDEMQRVAAFDENSLFLLGLRFAFLERTVYWMDGWHIFNDYPVLGVGLGNAGYSFISHLPGIGWSSIEVRAVVYQNESMPNIKSVWFRLLAETGILGFSLFVTWLLGLWSSARRSLRSQDATLKTIALAGQLTLLAYIFEGFSVDTFGLPYLFIMAGLVASAGMIYRRQVSVVY